MILVPAIVHSASIRSQMTGTGIVGPLEKLIRGNPVAFVPHEGLWADASRFAAQMTNATLEVEDPHHSS